MSDEPAGDPAVEPLNTTTTQAGQLGANVDISGRAVNVGQLGAAVDLAPVPAVRQEGGRGLNVDYSYPRGVQTAQEGAHVELVQRAILRAATIGLNVETGARPPNLATLFGADVLNVDMLIPPAPVPVPTGDVFWTGARFDLGAGARVYWNTSLKVFDTAVGSWQVTWTGDYFDKRSAP